MGGTASVRYHLLGYGDFIRLDYGLTQKGGSSRYAGSYTIPFNARNGTLSLGYSDANSKIVEEPSDYSQQKITFDLLLQP